MAKIDTHPPEVEMLKHALHEARLGQVHESNSRNQPINTASLTGGVAIYGAIDGGAESIPIISLAGVPPEIQTVSQEVGLSDVEKSNLLFLVEELKIPPWCAALEALSADSQSATWRQDMEAIYGRPDPAVDLPAVFSVAGMPEQYKTFLLLCMASNGAAVVNVDKFSADNFQFYQSQVSCFAGCSVEEIVTAVVNFHRNDQTLPGEEYWKVNMGESIYFVKKQKYLWPGMSSISEGVAEVQVLPDEVVHNSNLKIHRRGQIDDKSVSLKQNVVSGFRHVMSGGTRPAAIYVDTAGYWVRQGNIYDLAALESMTAIIPQRVQFQMNQEWQVRTDEMNLSVLHDYLLFLSQNSEKLINLDHARSQVVVAAIKEDSDGVRLGRVEMAQHESEVKPLAKLATRATFLEQKLESLSQWATRLDVHDISNLSSGVREAMADFTPNEYQQLMARVMGGSDFGEVIGTTSFNAEIAQEMRLMLDSGCLIFPTEVGGRYVMIDKDGIFLVKYEGNMAFSERLGINQHTKVMIEYPSNQVSTTLRLRSNWPTIDRPGESSELYQVEIEELDEDDGHRWLVRAQEAVRFHPLFSSLDKERMERTGPIGRVSVMPSEI